MIIEIYHNKALHPIQLRENGEESRMNTVHKENSNEQWSSNRGCCGRMVVGFTTNCAISVYHH